MTVSLEGFQREPKQPVVTDVALHLIDVLMSGTLAAGSKLPSERELSRTLGVGRSVVREALRSLDLLGLISVRQGDGTYVQVSDAKLLPRIIEWGLVLGRPRTFELVEARCHIEGSLASLAASRRNEQQLEELSAILRTMAAAETREDFLQADVAFHLKVGEIAGNAVLSDVLASIKSLLRVWIARVLESESNTVPSYLEHVSIYEAIAEGVPDGALRAMQRHLSSATDRLMAALKDTDEVSDDPAHVRSNSNHIVRS